MDNTSYISSRDETQGRNRTFCSWYAIPVPVKANSYNNVSITGKYHQISSFLMNSAWYLTGTCYSLIISIYLLEPDEATRTKAIRMFTTKSLHGTPSPLPTNNTDASDGSKSPDRWSQTPTQCVSLRQRKWRRRIQLQWWRRWERIEVIELTILLGSQGSERQSTSSLHILQIDKEFFNKNVLKSDAGLSKKK